MGKLWTTFFCYKGRIVKGEIYHPNILLQPFASFTLAPNPSLLLLLILLLILLFLLLLLMQMELRDLLKPISDHIQEIQAFRERNRGSSFFNHLSAVSESVPAIGWVAVVRSRGLIIVAAT